MSDIHSNLEALDSVAARVRGIPTYFCGDLVGYGANPNEVVEWAKLHCVGGVFGNHDQAVLTGDTGWFNPQAAEAIRWTRGVVTESTLDYLSSLPTFLRFQAGGKRFLIVHGSPDDPIHEYVHLMTHRDLFERYLQEQETDILALGHTHHPFAERTHLGTVFNPGSVGQPRHGVQGAFYAIVNVDSGDVQVQLLRATYDIEAAAARIYSVGLPRSLGERLFKGI